MNLLSSPSMAPTTTRWVTAGAIVVVLACASDTGTESQDCDPGTEPPDCTARLASGCWTFLGLDGQYVTALAETPWGLYAGTGDHGVFRRCGPSWVSVGLDLPRGYISALLYTPTNPPRLLAAIGPKADTAGQDTKGAVYATEDAGRSWLPWDGGLETRLWETRQNDAWALSLEMDPGNPHRLYLGLPGPVMRSQDGGATWQYVWGSDYAYGGWMGVYSLEVSPVRDGHVWAGAETALFTAAILRSADWGDSWEFVDPTPRYENRVTALVADPWDVSRVWAGVAGNRGGVLRSDDGGASWAYVLDPLTLDPRAEVSVFGLQLRQEALYALTAENPRPPTDTSHSGLMSDLGLYRTLDGGDTWDTLSVPEGTGGGLTLTLDARGRLLIATALGIRGSGVWRLEP